MPELRSKLILCLSWGLAVLGALAVAFQAALDSPLLDGFHEGEYLANRFYFDRPGPVPIMIHGMMDVLPAQLAQARFGTARLVAGTRLVNDLAGLGAALLFLFGMARTARSRAGQTIAVLLGSCVVLLIASTRPGIVNTQQGAPAVRDVAAMAVLCLLIEAGRARGKASEWIAGLAGLLAGLTLFWSYNRGLAAVGALTTWGLVEALQARALRPVWPPLAGLAAGLALNAALLGGFAGHLHSIAYWQAHGENWYRTYAGTEYHVLRVLCFGTVAFPAVAALDGLLRAWRKPGPGDAGVVAALTAAAALVLLSSLTRFEYLHATMVLPFGVLATSAAMAALARRDRARFPEPSRTAQGAMIVIAAALLIGEARRAGADLAANWTLLTGPALPRDSDLARPADLAVAAALRASPSPCAYAMDSQSTLLHLAGKPACSAFLIPLYAQGTAEPLLLADLQRTRPAVIVLRSQAWSWQIDDLPQDRRTPAVFAWLEANYTPAETIGGIQLARAKDPVR